MSLIRNLKVIGEDKKESFYCDLCNYPLVEKKDFEMSNSFNCCNRCYLEFVESRKEAWKNGWRPKKAVLNSYISIRRKLYKQKTNKEKK